MGSRRIFLTRGLFVTVDAEDYPRVSQFKWHAIKLGRRRDRFYAARSVTNPKRMIYLHRFILDAPESVEVDHIDRNTLDCRRSNLRFASDVQTAQNRCGDRGTTSSYKGVSFDKSKNRWRAQIKSGNLYLSKRFKSEVEAAIAYNFWAFKLFGRFAYLNKVCEG